MGEAVEGLSLRLAEFVTGTPAARISASAMRAAARVVLDATGVMRAASALSPEVEPFMALARAQGTGPARLLGTTQVAPAALAALANGAMAHALDYEDAFDAAPVHPNASLVPAVLALSQAHGPIDGRRFLAAIAITPLLVFALWDIRQFPFGGTSLNIITKGK